MLQHEHLVWECLGQRGAVDGDLGLLVLVAGRPAIAAIAVDPAASMCLTTPSSKNTTVTGG
jgi:hypothetical protein